ncbi:uncharacterized protein BDV14DRAFT_209038 [Aspergillus stella-maris]|uniref:uncharacterized protein n=1 Tax=Aspergillus stella-maris TaxID=1810926 RepID=UPI003CCD16E6
MSQNAGISISMSSSRGSKRQRICRACDPCRRRKSKCDGTQPVCKICQAAGCDCSYENGGGRRGLPTGYVRSLEAALGLLLQHIPHSEKTLLGALREPSAEGVRDLAVERWRASEVAPGLAEMMISGAGDMSFGTPGDDAWDIESSMVPASQEPQNLLPAAAGADSNNVLTYRASPSRDLKLAGPLDNGLPANTAGLLDFYFVHTHSWFPVLERRDLLRAIHTYPNDESSPHTSSHLLLWTERLLRRPGALDLGHIQALIILGLLYLQVGSIELAWILMGQAARRLVLLPASSKSGRFRNVFNGCMLLDNVASSILGRAPTLSPAEQSQIGPVDEDDIEDIFNQIRRLMDILSQILYSVRPINNAHSGLDSIMESTKAILSSHLQPTTDNATPPLLTLHLIPAFVEVSAFRQFGSLHISREVIDRAVNRTLDLLDIYTTITASARSSPLLQYFALQCHNCLATRLSAYLALPQAAYDAPGYIIRGPPLVPHSPIETAHRNTQNKPSTASENNPNTVGTGDFPSQPAGFHEFSPGTEINNTPTFPTPLSSLDTLAGPPLLGETDGLDDLYQEVVASFPSIGVEPAFAHNLGFYSDDLDVDFMSELRRTPNG